MRCMVAVAVALVCALSLVGCTSVDVFRMDFGQRPATSWQKVDVRFGPPSFAHKRLAMLKASDNGYGMSWDDLRAALQQEAARLGADAIILDSPSTHVGGAYAVTSGAMMAVGTTSVRTLSAVAIAYDILAPE